MSQRLALEGVSRSVNGETYLSGIQIAFEPGSFTTLLGRTGAGKTSLLRLLAGLDHPDSGKVYLGPSDITKLGVRHRDVAMVYQQFVNYPSLTVYENIASPLRVRGGVPVPELDRRVREMAGLLRIDHLLDRLPQALSGGQQQRTAIARALVKGARLVLLDEPLANLDYKLREELRSELRSLFNRSDAIVVYATADPSEALLFGGRSAVLDAGRVLQVGPPREVYDAPLHARVGQIVTDPEMNVLDAQIDAGGQVRLGRDDLVFSLPNVLAHVHPGQYRFGIRAHHLLDARSSATDIQLAAKVLLQESSGSQTVIHARCGTLDVTVQLPGIRRHPLGADLSLFVNPGRILLFDAQGWRVPMPEAVGSASPRLEQVSCHGAD